MFPQNKRYTLLKYPQTFPKTIMQCFWLNALWQSENEVILKIMWSYDQSYDWEKKMSSIYGYKHENFLNCTCFYHYVKKVNMVMFNIKYHIKSGNQIDTYIKGALGYLGIINMMFLQIKRELPKHCHGQLK